MSVPGPVPTTLRSERLMCFEANSGASANWGPSGFNGPNEATIASHLTQDLISEAGASERP